MLIEFVTCKHSCVKASSEQCGTSRIHAFVCVSERLTVGFVSTYVRGLATCNVVEYIYFHDDVNS